MNRETDKKESLLSDHENDDRAASLFTADNLRKAEIIR